jgi:hypothetical protein
MEQIKKNLENGFKLIGELDKLIERWSVIEDYDNYSVSTFGRVRNDKTGQVLKPFSTGRYMVIELKGKGVKVHRLVAQHFLNNNLKKSFVDHIDTNTSNNHFSNLRYSTPSENTINRNKFTNNTTGFTGVYWNNETKKWRVRVAKKHIGYFYSFDEAKEARIKAVNKMFGEYTHSSQQL